MNTLIVGMGEIGKALSEILSENYDVYCIDANSKERPKELKGTFEIMHISFPYSENFIQEVWQYQQKYQPKYTVVHSTVPVGTCKNLNATHSPVIGIHPFLEESIKTFTKYLGGEKASEIADYFRRAGFKIYLTDKSETTELMKILDTTFYGVCVEYVKDVKMQCEKIGVPFEMWTLWTQNYNDGYEKMGRKEFTRPNLVPIMKEIGGHCVKPNAKMLNSKFTDLIN